jgi:membrane associated rhomboid family serine protease
MIPLSDDPKRRSFPWVTVLIILANIAVFLYELSIPSVSALDRWMLEVGVVPCVLTGVHSQFDVCPPTSSSPLLSLITSMFVHGGFLHIASNMLYLWVFGDNVEDSFGKLGYTAFYLVAGIAAGLAQVFINPSSSVPSIGASGAIAGVLGAYIVLFPHAQVRTLLFLGPFITFPRLPSVLMIGFWFVTQILSGLASLGVTTEQQGGVAFWAHIGGFVAGVVIALLFRPRLRSDPRPAW